MSYYVQYFDTIKQVLDLFLETEEIKFIADLHEDLSDIYVDDNGRNQIRTYVYKNFRLDDEENNIGSTITEELFEKFVLYGDFNKRGDDEMQIHTVKSEDVENLRRIEIIDNLLKELA